MTVKIHPKTFDENHVVISNEELKTLIKSVEKTRQIKIELIDDIQGENLMKLSEASGSLKFLLNEAEDIYTLEDLKVKYK